MSLKKIVTHIFIWTLPTNVATTGRDSPNGREFYAHSPLQKLKWEAGSARPDVKNRDLPSKMEKFTLKWKPLLYTMNISPFMVFNQDSSKIYRIKISASQTSHRRQIGNEFTQGIGGRKAGFGEFWGTWGIEHIRNDEEGGMVEYKLIVEGFFEFYMFPSFRLNVSWSLWPVFLFA